MNVSLVVPPSLQVFDGGPGSLLQPILSTAVIGVLGIALLMLAIWVLDKLTTYSIHRQLEEEKNVAVAIVVAAVILGISIVIGSVAQG